MEEERLLAALPTPMGYHKGRPLAAMVIFRCCLQWRAFQADRTSVFDRIIHVRARLRSGGGLTCSAQQCMGSVELMLIPILLTNPIIISKIQVIGAQIERHQEDNPRLCYWLTNTTTLLFLLQRNIKPASSGSLKGRAQAAGRAAGSMLNSWLGRGASMGGGEASIHGGGVGGFRLVEAKYPALLFKQQLDAFVQKIFPMLRDNVKKAITPLLVRFCRTRFASPHAANDLLLLDTLLLLLPQLHTPADRHNPTTQPTPPPKKNRPTASTRPAA